MRTIMNIIAAGVVGLFALGLSAASAEYRPDQCYQTHDHRSHAADYYNYYPSDPFSRAGPYNRSGVSVSLSFGNNRYAQRRHNNGYAQRRNNDHNYRRGNRNDHNYRRGNRNDHNYRRGNRSDQNYRRGSRVVNREVFQTRYRARIVLVEEISYRRGHGQKVCTVSVRGPDAHHVSHRRARQIANNYCSRNARIRVSA